MLGQTWGRRSSARLPGQKAPAAGPAGPPVCLLPQAQTGPRRRLRAERRDLCRALLLPGLLASEERRAGAGPAAGASASEERRARVPGRVQGQTGAGGSWEAGGVRSRRLR